MDNYYINNFQWYLINHLLNRCWMNNGISLFQCIWFIIIALILMLVYLISIIIHTPLQIQGVLANGKWAVVCQKEVVIEQFLFMFQSMGLLWTKSLDIYDEISHYA